ncbi:hypothetical protein R3P38DRAFT_3243980 [Favolaschia claudopus]|uniref:Uncharacterized protein n=1 Tax=Favolaschia claudopus TaxID=2862362 RepID=A0AAV9Z2E1_9AGAR
MPDLQDCDSSDDEDLTEGHSARISSASRNCTAPAMMSGTATSQTEHKSFQGSLLAKAKTFSRGELAEGRLTLGPRPLYSGSLPDGTWVISTPLEHQFSWAWCSSSHTRMSDEPDTGVHYSYLSPEDGWLDYYLSLERRDKEKEQGGNGSVLRSG